MSDNLKNQTNELRQQNQLLAQQREDFASISGIISGNLAELGKTKDAFNASVSSARKLRSISDTLLANSREGANLSVKELEKIIERAEKEKDILGSKVSSLEISKAEKDSLNDIIKQGDDLVKVAKERLAVETEIEKQSGLLGAGLKSIEGILRKAGFGDIADRLNFKDAIRDATTFNDKTGKASFSLSAAFKNIGKNLRESIKATDLLVFGLKKLFDAAKAADTNVANIRRNFGVTASEGIKLNDSFAKTAILTGDFTANVESLQEANQNINNQLGIQVRLNDELLVAANALVKRNKLSAEAAAGFSQQVLATGIGANALLDASAETVAAIQNQTGVQLSFNSILEESNKISGQLRANLLRTPDGLVKAVATAKTLGVEMAEIAGIAGQLLDFESSITKELEAELLIGKDLNLEQARLLALQGKSDEAVSSLVSQVGTLEDFQKLNVIQQNALASAVGMTSDQLATTVEKQAAINSQKQDGLNIDAEAMKEGASALSIQEKLASAVEKLNSILQMTGVVIGGIVGAVSGFLFGGPIGALIGLIAGGSIIGGIQAVSDGIAPPNRGPFTITDSYGSTAITAKGDGVAVSPNISQGSGESMKETNRLLRAYLEKGTQVNVVNTDFNNQMSATSYAIQ